MTVTLPAGLSLRAPSMEDLQAITDLAFACEITDAGSSDVDSETVLDLWNKLDLAANAFVFVTPAGQIVGYTGIKAYGQLLMLDPHTNIHPNYRGRGLEQILLQLVEQRMRALVATSNGTLSLEIKTWSSSQAKRLWLEQAGYIAKSSELSMAVDLREHPPTFQPLHDIHIRQAILTQDEQAIHHVVQEAFQDIGGYPYRPFEEWKTGVMGSASFDPNMLYVALDDTKIVGAILCRTYLEAGDGFVQQVATLRKYRRRGIAMKLLQKVFVEYTQRDIYRVVLNVDTHNTTGAHELYARAGMRREGQVDEMHKMLG